MPQIRIMVRYALKTLTNLLQDFPSVYYQDVKIFIKGLSLVSNMLIRHLILGTHATFFG